MIKIYLTTLSIVLLSLTIAVSVIKPNLNKPVQFSVKEMQFVSTEVAQVQNSPNKLNENIKIDAKDNSNLKITEKVVDIKTPTTQNVTKVVEQKNNVITKNVQVETNKTQSKSSTKIIDTKSTKPTTKEVVKEVVKPKTETKTIITELPTSVKEIIKEVPNTQIENKDIELEKPSKQDVQVKEQVVVLPKVESKPIEQMTPEEIIKQAEKEDRLLNEREEIVVWNVWRSNLQNQIMQDTQISAPLGTVFKFSFTVDKKGRISNLRTWAQPSMYNSVAINYLKPLILSYQGQSILNFPSRTKRVITNVTGGFTISTEDKFSTPNDFSDIERIRTTR